VKRHSAFRIPHSALESLFLHGESEDGPVFSGTYGLRLFSTCISRRRLRNVLIMLIQELRLATCFTGEGSGIADCGLRISNIAALEIRNPKSEIAKGPTATQYRMWRAFR
jgi:hypothetical protein